MAKNKQGTSHDTQLTRLKRIEGQVRGISNMVEEKRYCIDIITQLKAVRSAMARVEQNVIESHLNHCVHKAISSKNKKEATEMVSEIKELLKNSMK